MPTPGSVSDCWVVYRRCAPPPEPEELCNAGVDVAGSVQEVEHLGGLGDGTEEGVVAAGALTFLLVTDGAALGVPAGGWHGAVEVQGDTGQSQAGQALAGEVPETA